MPYLLNLVYLLLLLVSLPWLLVQAARKGKYREGYGEKLFGRVPTRRALTPSPSPETGEGSHTKTCIWLHAVSVGEVNLLAPLLKKIEQERPEWHCVLSTTTMTGMSLARKKYPRQTAFYCPLDFSWAVKTAMRRIRPDVLVLAELELWPNLIRAAKRRGARVAVMNGRLGEKSFRGYRRIRPLVASVMRQIDLLAVQDETYAERFRTLGARPEAVHVTGSMKYDGAQTDRDNPATRRLAELAGFTPDDIVILAGSTQEPEEEMAIAAFRELSPEWPRLRLVLVPRHPDRFEAVARLLDVSGVPYQRRTKLDESRKTEARTDGQSATDSTLSPPILLVDVVGELGAWWGTARIAYVGGSMGRRGGQNMIEPAAYGATVCFGPNTWNFRDIVAAMLAHDAAVVVADAGAFTRFVRGCLEQADDAGAMGQRARTFVRSQLGATDRTWGLLDALIGGTASQRVASCAKK